MIRSNPALREKQIAIRAKKSGNLVTLKWTTWPNGKPAADPTNGATLATDSSHPVEASKTFRAFWEEIGPSTSTFRVHAEIQTGDGILRMPSDVVIDGLDGAYFIINGEKWVQKATGAALTKSWDVTVADHKLLRRVLLRKAT